ncbi:MAG: hypothetical protein KIS92_14925 [Planctomycetota bacterium]|nr:hypothetical protein [Planctomycetota bacterium]
MRAVRHPLIRTGLTALALFACGLRAEDELPAAWKTWADRAYATRYLLEVFAPPPEGATGLQPENNLAAIVLPLKTLPILGARENPDDPDAQTSRPEDVLLLDEDGAVVPLLIRQTRGGNEVQLAFPYKKGQRRFCLYAGAPAGAEVKASPADFAPKALRVRVQAMELSEANTPGEKKGLSLERFRAIPLDEGRLHQDLRKNIDDDEPIVPPYVEDPNRQRPRLRNLERYAAVYEGYLRTPRKGSYEFALTTFGAGYLLIDNERVAGSDLADPNRGPYALTGRKELSAGVHRVVVYFAQGGTRTGLCVQWKPPGEASFLAIPSQAFVRGMPAVVARVEQRGEDAPVTATFLHVETLGQCRTGLHRGPAATREWVNVFVQAVGPLAGEGRIVRLTAPGTAPVTLPSDGGCAWMPAGGEITAHLLNRGGTELPAPVARTFACPLEDAGGRDVDLLQGELALKAAPQFVYPDETGQLHLEAQLNPLPVLTSKERIERGMLRQQPVAHGQFLLRMRVTGADGQGDTAEAGKELSGDAELDATPDDAGRRKIRVPVEGAKLAEFARGGKARLELELLIGGVPAERLVFRLLHARMPWPGEVTGALDRLECVPEKNAAPERVLVLVPREDEADYRRFQPLGVGLFGGSASSALFVGDPLVEAPESTKPTAPIGLAGRLNKGLSNITWTNLCLPGPQKGRFVFRLLAETEARLRAFPDGKAPELAVVSIGGSDAAGQTPMPDFERGLDVLVDRLRLAGVRRILLLGVVPEPGRAEQGALYQERWADLVRQHHLESLDIYSQWTRRKEGAEKDWPKRFALDPEGKSPVFGPSPNAASLDEIAEQIKAILK